VLPVSWNRSGRFAMVEKALATMNCHEQTAREHDQLGKTTVRLPLGGVASSSAEEVRSPLVRPLWLLGGVVVGALLTFLWLRLFLF
jgi:hypothetical protein